MARLGREEAGQTNTEYLMVVGLMAAVIVAVFAGLFWPPIQAAATAWVDRVVCAISFDGTACGEPVAERRPPSPPAPPAPPTVPEPAPAPPAPPPPTPAPAPEPPAPPAPPPSPPPAPPPPPTVRFDDPRHNGMPIDHCVNYNTACGKAGADWFCRSMGYTEAASWRVAYPGQTVVLGDGRICSGAWCGAFTSVECRVE